MCFKKYFIGVLMCKSSSLLRIASSHTFGMALHSWEKFFLKLLQPLTRKTFKLTNSMMAAVSTMLLLYLQLDLVLMAYQVDFMARLRKM